MLELVRPNENSALLIKYGVTARLIDSAVKNRESCPKIQQIIYEQIVKILCKAIVASKVEVEDMDELIRIIGSENCISKQNYINLKD